jgi:uncharacterized membrane protein
MANVFHHPDKGDFQLERLILFSDAVFAIAITLLVIELKVPELDRENYNDAALAHELKHLVPRFMGFVISFAIIGVYWAIHHRLFGFVHKYSNRLIFLNMLFLFSIVLMPFSTGMFGEYSRPSAMKMFIPFAIYVGNISLTGFSNYFLWNYACNPSNGIAAGFPDQHYVKMAKRRSLVVPVVFLIALIVSIWYPIQARYIPIFLVLIFRIFFKLSKRNKPKNEISPN